MLPVFGRPFKAQRDTQSSERGVVTTKEHHCFAQATTVQTERIVPRYPDR